MTADLARTGTETTDATTPLPISDALRNQLNSMWCSPLEEDEWIPIFEMAHGALKAMLKSELELAFCRDKAFFVSLVMPFVSTTRTQSRIDEIVYNAAIALRGRPAMKSEQEIGIQVGHLTCFRNPLDDPVLADYTSESVMEGRPGRPPQSVRLPLARRRR